MSKATTISKFFSRTTSVSIDINTTSDKVWTVLTDLSKYKDWNSTIVNIEGVIDLGNTIRLTSTLDPKRTFKLKVKQYIPRQLLVWGDPMGKRTFTLTELKGKTNLTMTEKIGGPIFPLFASKIPSFDENFDKFVNDLKKEAEK